jgi:catecholate siderophore receptor
VPVLPLVLSLLLAIAQIPASADGQLHINGTVIDASGAPVAGAAVKAVALAGGAAVTTSTNERGQFSLSVPSGRYRLTVESAGFEPYAEVVSAGAPAIARTVVLEIEGVRETVSVKAPVAYNVPEVSSATRTPTPLREVPQSISIVTASVIADQRMQSMADVVRYMPGVGIAQGEGNRDTPVLRGNATTADFFVDGVRDDVQYMRDLYNVERIEALKGPNAMIFGRGGAGGVINRVTRQAGWGLTKEVTVQAGSWNDARLSADLGARIAHNAAGRLTGVFQRADSYRGGVGLERYGVNPTAALRLGDRTMLRAGYEYFHDERTADRGVSSLQGRPIEAPASLFFGDPSQSRVEATVNVFTSSLDHAFGGGASVRSRVTVGDYDKFYQNVFPGAADAGTNTVQISAYNNRTQRTNTFAQTDVVVPVHTGRVSHIIVAGAELGRQVSDNFRNTGFFTSAGANVSAFTAPLANPTISVPITFRQSATDADNHGVATVAAAYVQDQVRLNGRLQVVGGVRVDRFAMDLHNNRTSVDLSSTDTLWSPRAGIIYNVVPAASVYGSFSLSYVPRAGEQLTSLTPTNRTLEPEQFRNYELGAKWDVTRALALNAAVYRLDRHNAAVPDPQDPTRLLLVDAQRTLGLEVGINGNLTPAWSVAGGYAMQDGEITHSLSSTAQAGASLAQLPRHSFSLWNKYQMTGRLAAGLGVIHRGDAFTSTDNRVVMPGFTRADAAVFFDVTRALRAQLNVENLSDAAYFASAHSNTNILPGSPRAVRLSLVARF